MFKKTVDLEGLEPSTHGQINSQILKDVQIKRVPNLSTTPDLAVGQNVHQLHFPVVSCSRSFLKSIVFAEDPTTSSSIN